MGQSQSPPKFCARPSSNMFQNNLAQKIKDSAYKKHLSTHAFLRTSSKYSKSSDSENSSCNTSNVNSPKQDFKMKKQNLFSHNHNFTETGQGANLSDIQQNEAEYEDEEIKKINKTYANGTQKETNKSQKASDEKIALEESKKQSVEQGTKIEKGSNHYKQKCQSVKNKKQLKINEEKQLKLSDYDQSNLILFTESKKVSSCKSLGPENATKSKKNSELLNADSNYNINLQLESNKSSSKHQQSGTETYRNGRNSVKLIKIRSENEEFRPTIETRIKSRKAPEVGGVQMEEQKLQKTVVNSRKGGPYKDENSITIKEQNLYKTAHHQNDNSKGKLYKQPLFRSCKKVYASQISLESQLSPPQSPSYYQQKQIVRGGGVNKLIHSKSFQEDFSIKRDSLYDRKSDRQKMRDSISLGKMRKKLAQSMHHLHLHDQEIETKDFMRKFGQNEDKKVEQQEIKLKGSRLSLSSRLRSKIRQKLSLSKTHSQKSSFSSSQRLSQTHMRNSRQQSKKSRLSVRESIRKMNEIQQMENLQNTQDNYFNENINDNTLSPVIYDLKNNNNQIKLRQSIIKQTIRPSEYEIKAVKEEISHNKQKTFNLNSSKLDNTKSRTKVQNIKHTKGIYMFTENAIDQFQEGNFANTKNKTVNDQQIIKVDKKSNQLNVENIKDPNKNSLKKLKLQFHETQKNPKTPSNLNTQTLQGNQNKQVQQKISQQNSQDKKYRSPHRTKKNPQQIQNSPNYIKQDIKTNHLSVQYSNKKNPQPQDKKPINLIKFSQLQPNPFDLIQNEKLIKTTSAKNYPFNENSKIIASSNLKDLTAKNVEIIDKLINNPINSKSKDKKQINRNDDYESFIQQLEKLMKIKEIQQKLIKQNMENLKKSSSSHNKVSILDLNKQIINEQITMKVERMNKLKELNKLTKKMDPAMLIKSKSSQLLRQQYENVSKAAKIKQKKTGKKHQNSLEKDLYYNFSKQMSNLSHLKDYNQKSGSKIYKSLKQLNASSHEYMIDVSKVQKTKHLKKSKVNTPQLACIPESPQIQYNPWKDHETGLSKIRKVQKKINKDSKIQAFANQASRSMDTKRIGNQRESHGAMSLQKTRDQRKLIVF